MHYSGDFSYPLDLKQYHQFFIPANEKQQQEVLLHKALRYFNEEKNLYLSLMFVSIQTLKTSSSLPISSNCNFICDHVIKASLKIFFKKV